MRKFFLFVFCIVIMSHFVIATNSSSENYDYVILDESYGWVNSSSENYGYVASHAIISGNSSSTNYEYHVMPPIIRGVVSYVLSVVLLTANNLWTSDTTPEILVNCTNGNVTDLNVTLYFNSTDYGVTTCTNASSCSCVVNDTLFSSTVYSYYASCTDFIDTVVSSVQTLYLYPSDGGNGSCDLSCLGISDGCSVSFEDGCSLIQ